MKAKLLTLDDFIEDGMRIKELMLRIAESSGGEFTVKTLIDCISKGTHSPWGWLEDDGMMSGIIITNVVQYSQYKCFSVVGAAGDAIDYNALHSLFNHVAKGNGCQRFEIRGRRGFAKKFAGLGWKEKYTVIECDVFDENNVALINQAQDKLEDGSDGDNGSERVPGGTEAVS
jgi:hypothetical protein